MTDLVTFGYAPGSGVLLVTLGFGSEAGLPVVPGTTTLVIRGFQSGLLVTRGLGVFAPVVPLTCYPDPFLASATVAVDPFAGTAAAVLDPFAATATTTVDPFAATSRLKC